MLVAVGLGGSLAVVLVSMRVSRLLLVCVPIGRVGREDVLDVVDPALLLCKRASLAEGDEY